MSGFGGHFDIILFAMIAVFLVLRLRSVLGRRTGNERDRHQNWMSRRPGPVPGNAPPPDERAKAAVIPMFGGAARGSLADRLGRIREADPGFDPREFIEGARGAFGLIVNGFARGDKAALRPLLSDEVYPHFAEAIDSREAARESYEARIDRIRGAEIVEAGLQDRTAQITVKIVSDQINVTRASDGSVVDGDPDRPIEKTDYWTFARDTRAADPNWVLVATEGG